MLSLCSVICCVCYMDGFSISSTKVKIMIVSLCINYKPNALASDCPRDSF